MAKFDLSNVTVGQLLDDPQAKAILEKHVPDLLNHPMLGMARGMQISAVLAMAGGQIDQSVVDTIKKEIEAL